MYRYFCAHCAFEGPGLGAVIRHLFTVHNYVVLTEEDWRTELVELPRLIDVIVESAA